MSEFPNSAHQVIEQADPTDPHPEATLCPRSTTVATPPIHIAEHFTTLENVRNGLEIGRKVWEDPVFPACDRPSPCLLGHRPTGPSAGAVLRGPSTSCTSRGPHFL